jgi:hypothetical protein
MPDLHPGAGYEPGPSRPRDSRPLDERFYDLEGTGETDKHMLAFARERPADFYFSGTVERVVFPTPSE